MVGLPLIAILLNVSCHYHYIARLGFYFDVPPLRLLDSCHRKWINLLVAPSPNYQTRYQHSAAVSLDSTVIPDFSKYKKTSGPDASRAFTYVMVGTTGFLSAAGAKATVQDFLSNMSASADVLALAKVEVELASIPEGKNATIKWRGKPVFIRHRTSDEIAEANATNLSELRDPQADSDRTKQPEWLVMLGVCTHLYVSIGYSGIFWTWSTCENKSLPFDFCDWFAPII